MAEPILQTKLFIPELHSLVARPHLIQKLEEGRQAGQTLALISSSAGSGKTCLLSEWSAASQSVFAWFSIDDGDNEPARFWTYLMAAIQRASPGLGQTAAQLLASSPSIPIQTVLTALINEFVSSPVRLELVLDDYHDISNLEIHNGIAFLLEHLPAHVGVAISTRADPPLPVFRLRAHNLLTEIREADLRFSLYEARQFLMTTMGLDLAQDEIEALENRTEGWIAGLQLAALALKLLGARGRHELVEQFSGSHEFVLEYLVEEVLARQEPSLQDFLIRTSILERLSAPLCDAILTGEGRSQATLDHLEHANLFTFSLDGEHRWFRYHRLFADLLSSRLRSVASQEEISQLHRRAAAWLAQNGLTGEAIQQALAAGDAEMAADFIEPAARPMMFSGQVNQLKGWLDALPKSTLKAHIRLAIFQNWIDYIQGKCELYEGNLQETDALVASLPQSPENERLKVEYAVLLCRFVALAGNSNRAIAMAGEALKHLPEDDLASRARVYSALSIAYGVEGQVEEAEAVYRTCFQLAQASGYFSLLAHTALIVGMGQSNWGRLRSPARDYKTVLELGAKSAQGVFYPAGQAYIGLAAINLEWNDLQSAEEYLVKGMELCQQGGLDGIYNGLVVRSRLRQARRDLQGALEDVRSAEDILKRKDYMTIAREVQILIAWMDLKALAQMAAALKPIVQHDPGAPRIPILFEEVLMVSLVRILLAQGDVDAALRLMDERQGAVESGGRLGRLIELHFLRALALVRQAQGKSTPEAVEYMRSALELAEPEGFVRLFLEEGPEAAPILKAIAVASDAPEQLKKYAFHLFESLSPERKTTVPPVVTVAAEKPKRIEPASRVEAIELVEPLSKREMDILKLVCEGYSNQEIAGRLVIALFTVKKHISNIFGKLGVNSRTQAVARARQLRLME